MSEVILETSNMIWQKSGKPIKEIVRCRDCAYLEPVGGKGNPTHRCGLKFVNFESWNSALDGFCAWGKRRES